MDNLIDKEMSFPFLDKGNDQIKVSFEFFPPNTEKMAETLWNSVKTLAPIKPEFVSVTYGAAGSTRDRTHAVIKRIKEETNLEVAAHLTCIGSSKEEIQAIAENYWNEGVRHIVALRGDLPEGYVSASNSYKHASELVEALKKIADFEISVGGYPEKHPEAADMATDIDNLKRKVDAGADRIISQFFMEPKVFLNFVDKARAAGINVPIVPGILPITNFESTQKFAKACGASIPDWMLEKFSNLGDNNSAKQLIAAAIAVEQCKVLHRNGIDEFHFYTLNRAELSLAICNLLGKSLK